MSTEDIISARRDAAIQKWTEAVFAMYPFETTGFIRTQRDQFANPSATPPAPPGNRSHDAVTGRDVDMEKVHASVAALIRIRAVQDLKPEQAVGVLYLYKSVLRELLLADMLVAGDVQGFLDMGIVWTRSASWPSTCTLRIGSRSTPSVWPNSAGRRLRSGAGRPDMAWWKIRTGNRPCFLFPFRNPFYCGYGFGYVKL